MTDPRLAELTTEALRAEVERLRTALVVMEYQRTATTGAPKRGEPGWVNPLSNFDDDENDRMSWQQDEWEPPARTATTEAEALAARLAAQLWTHEGSECWDANDAAVYREWEAAALAATGGDVDSEHGRG